MVSVVKVSHSQAKSTLLQRIKTRKMASEQANANEAIAKAVAEATRVAIQAMATAITERPQNVGTQDRQTCNEAAKF